jgi:hypothetical protein
MKKFIGIIAIIAIIAAGYLIFTKPYEAIEGEKISDCGHVMTVVGENENKEIRYYRQIWEGWDRYIPESLGDYYNGVGLDKASADHWTVMAKTW